jgi:hypothetical protein
MLGLVLAAAVGGCNGAPEDRQWRTTLAALSSGGAEERAEARRALCVPSAVPFLLSVAVDKCDPLCGPALEAVRWICEDAFWATRQPDRGEPYRSVHEGIVRTLITIVNEPSGLRSESAMSALVFIGGVVDRTQPELGSQATRCALASLRDDSELSRRAAQALRWMPQAVRPHVPELRAMVVAEKSGVRRLAAFVLVMVGERGEQVRETLAEWESVEPGDVLVAEAMKVARVK